MEKKVYYYYFSGYDLEYAIKNNKKAYDLADALSCLQAEWNDLNPGKAGELLEKNIFIDEIYEKNGKVYLNGIEIDCYDEELKNFIMDCMSNNKLF